MTNSEKFKTADERANAFDEYCQSRICNDCPVWNNDDSGNCRFAWLDEEVEKEKPLPCPYCGSETRVEEYIGFDHKPHYRVVCDDCYMQSCVGTRDDVVEKYNRMARVVIEAGKKEV